MPDGHRKVYVQNYKAKAGDAADQERVDRMNRGSDIAQGTRQRSYDSPIND